MTSPRLHVLDLGRMRMDKSLLIARWQLASRTNPQPAAEFVEFPVSAYLLDHPDGRILFDAGCHPQAMGKGGRWPQEFQDLFPWTGGEECHLPNRLQALGLGPDDLRYVVLSHLHNDHAGCVEFFRRSHLVVHEDEFAAALRAYALQERMGPYVWADTDHWIRLGLNWKLVRRDEAELELCDSATILNWGSGHAHGMLGLHVRLPATGGIILASDAIYCAANYGPPIRPQGVIYDSVGYERTIERIRRLAEKTRSQVWFGHDLAQFSTLRHSPNAWYE